MDIGYKDVMAAVSWQHTVLLDQNSIQNFDPYGFLCQLTADHPELFLKRSELSTILSELYSNALEHGLLQLPSSLKNSVQGMLNYYEIRQKKLEGIDAGQIIIHLNYQGSSESPHHVGVIEITVEDSGKGFNYRKQMLHSEKVMDNPKGQQYAGRGMALVSALCRKVEYLEKGNKVKATYFIENS